ncbi:RlpA-like protein, double-psi beta-barrel domain [Sesbania bispinosa]|nr:RlpA-like protein, double-psi beta-barrel domain [Sesbania bispinosa]
MAWHVMVQVGGACGFGDYGKTVNGGSVAAVSARLWKNGVGCGACYQVRCKIPKLCNVNGAYVVVTDYGEGDKTDFILSPQAFSRLGHANLSKYGVVDIEYKRVPCTFRGYDIVFQVHESSKIPDYFAIVVLYVGGTYEVTGVEMWQRDHHQWEPLRRTYGAVFDFANPSRDEIRLRFQVSRNVELKWVESRFAIPRDWKVGATYATRIQPY